MLRRTASKVMWVGRTAAALFGLALVLALVLGVATMALAAVPGDPFKLGQLNRINDALTTLIGRRSGAMMAIDNDSTATNARALDLRVEPNRVPMAVNSDKKVTNLNADKVDGLDSTDLLHKPVVRAEGLASYQSVPNTAPFNGNPVRLQFPTEHFDTDDMHSTTQDTERFTATRAGYYWVSAGVEWAFSENGASGSRMLQIEYATSNGNGRAYPVSEIPGSTGSIVQQGGQLLHLNVGDFVYARVFQTSGNTLNAHGTIFDAYWVSP